MQSHDRTDTSEDNTPGREGPWVQHEQIAAYLRQGILRGQYPPGSNLPSTRALKEKFGAAPQTIKNATEMLAAEGLVYSHRGKGIVVRPHRRQTVRPADYKEPAAPGEPYRWLDAAEKRGRQARSELLRVEQVEPPADVAAALGIPAGGKAVLREQLLMLDEEPAELVQSYYPLDLAQGTAIEQKRKIKGGTPRLLADMGHLPARCVDEVSAELPTPDQQVVLRMPTRSPVLQTFRVVYSTAGRVIEATLMVKAGNLYRLRYEF